MIQIRPFPSHPLIIPRGFLLDAWCYKEVFIVSIINFWMCMLKDIVLVFVNRSSSGDNIQNMLLQMTYRNHKFGFRDYNDLLFRTHQCKTFMWLFLKMQGTATSLFFWTVSCTIYDYVKYRPVSPPWITIWEVLLRLVSSGSIYCCVMFGAKELTMVQVKADGTLKYSLKHLLSASTTDELLCRTGSRPGDLLLMTAGSLHSVVRT